MKHTHTLAMLITALGTLSAHAQFRNLWQLGDIGNGQAEFSQENFGSNPPPGSPTAKDDDYYFAGDYTDPNNPNSVGIVTEDELLQAGPGGDDSGAGTIGFERAVTGNDPNNRIHFVLDAAEVDAAAVYRLTSELRDGGFGGGNGAFGNHDVTISFNDNEIFNASGLEENTPVEVEFSPTDVNAVAGENIVTVSRTGGGTGGWISIDFVRLEIDESNIACTDPICNFTADQMIIGPGDQVSLSWLTSAAADVSIEPELGAVDAGSGSAFVFPDATTTYTISSTLNGVTETRDITIQVRVIETFNADPVNLNLGEPSTFLTWQVDDLRDDIMIEIDQGLGDQSANTFFGAGDIEISPTETTTYTLTATRPNTPMDDVDTASITINYDPSLIFSFSASALEVTPANPNIDLEWTVPDVDGLSLSISPDPGDVTADTTGDFGTTTVTVTEDTTYTLTATFEGRTETMTVDVVLNNFTELWQIGVDDDSQDEFARESNSSTDGPGSAMEKDDDYYFAGTYPDPIGVVTENEVLEAGNEDDTLNSVPGDDPDPDRTLIGFERALTAGDPNSRIHFNLTAEQASAENEIRLIVDLERGGWFNSLTSMTGAGFGVHDIEISMNDQPIFSMDGITSQIVIQEVFSTTSVNAQEGPNVIEISRPSGDSVGNGTNSGWIQFDYISAGIRAAAPVEPSDDFTVTGSINAAGDQYILTFPSTPGETFDIQSGIALNDFADLMTAVPADPAPATETSVEIDITPETVTKFFLRVTRN